MKSLSFERKTCTPTPDDIASYRDNGFFIARGLFSREECDAIYERAEAQAEDHYGPVLNLHDADPEFLNFLRDSRMVSLLEGLQSLELVGLHNQINFKKAGTPYGPQPWNPHQDNSYTQNPSNLYLTTNLFLEDADRENGCMYYYPGSQAEGILPFEPTISYRETPGERPGNNIPEIPDKYVKTDLIAKKGDLLVMNGCLVHGSYANNSKTRSRPMIACTYLPRGEAFEPGRNAKRRPIELHVA